MTISRREMIKVSAGAGAALLLNEWPAFAQERSMIILCKLGVPVCVIGPNVGV